MDERVLARLQRPRARSTTKIAVVADPHVGVDSDGTMKQFEHALDNFETALADATARGIDAVVSPGDLTKDGEPRNYRAVRDAIDDLGVPFYAVPGNHDVPKTDDDHETPSLDAYERWFTPGSLPFHVTVGGVDVVGFNTAGSDEALADTHEGAILDEDRVAELLAGADRPIALTHYNLPPITAQLCAYRDAGLTEMAIPPELRDAEAVAALLNRHDVPLVLTGHLHLSSAGRVGPTTEVTAPATCSFPQAYLVVTVDDRGTTITFVPVAGRDRLTDAHVALQTDGATGRGLAGVASVRLAEFPLFDDR